MNQLIAALTSADTLRALASWLPRQRWFDGTGHPLAQVSLVKTHLFAAPTGAHTPAGSLVVLGATDERGADAGTYLLPLGADAGERRVSASAVVATSGDLVVYDALDDNRLVSTLLRRIARGLELDRVTYCAEPPGLPVPADALPVRPLDAEQSNSSVIIDDQFILKFFRRVSPGPSPDLVLHRMLAAAGSAYIPPLLGAVEDKESGATYATLQQFLSKAEDGWSSALDSVQTWLASAEEPQPVPAEGDFAPQAHTLGRAVAAVHQDLAATAGTAVLTRLDYRHLSQRFLDRMDHARTLVPQLKPYTDRLRASFTAVGDLKEAPHQATHLTHGDLHLGQTLRTPQGWLLLDFEGEPLADRKERAVPHSPLQDVAGMLRSFDYAAHHELTGGRVTGRRRRQAQEWAMRNQRAFLSGYGAHGGHHPPAGGPLLTAYTLDKAVYEALYDIQHRPAWAWIPLQALERALVSGHT